MAETALVVEVPAAEPVVHRWRDRHDPIVRRRMVAHITSLYPFVPPSDFDDTTLDALRSALEGIRRFDFDLRSVESFAGVIWLRPDPEEPFRSLTRTLCSAFPGYLPYGGLHADPQPHLTIAKTEDAGEREAPLLRIREELGPSLPIRATATALSVFMTEGDGPWRRVHVLELA